MSAPLSPREKLLRAITEAQWQARVESLLHAARFDYWHAPDNLPSVSRSGSVYVQNVRGGWPDVVAVKGSRGLALELKREGPAAHREPGQLEWLMNLYGVGFEVAFLRPSDEAMLRKVLAGESLSLVDGHPYGTDSLRLASPKLPSAKRQSAPKLPRGARQAR